MINKPDRCLTKQPLKSFHSRCFLTAFRAAPTSLQLSFPPVQEVQLVSESA